MTTCRELTDFLDDYVGGKLPARMAFSFRLHLALCRTCRSYLRSYRKTIQLAREGFSNPKDSIPTPMPDAMVRAILAAKRSGDNPGP